MNTVKLLEELKAERDELDLLIRGIEKRTLRERQTSSIQKVNGVMRAMGKPTETPPPARPKHAQPEARREYGALSAGIVQALHKHGKPARIGDLVPYVTLGPKYKSTPNQLITSTLNSLRRKQLVARTDDGWIPIAPSPPPSDVEEAVRQALVAHGGPAFPRHLHAQMGPETPYTTQNISNALTRLHRRRLAKKTKAGWTPVSGEASKPLPAPTSASSTDRVASALTDAPQGPVSLVAVTGFRRSQIDKALQRLLKTGRARKLGYGEWVRA